VSNCISWRPARHRSSRSAGCPERLAETGRSWRLFGVADGIEVSSTGSQASAVLRNHGRDQVGLVVRRDGARSGWMNLPHDMVGSVLDAVDLASRLTTLLSVLVDVDMSPLREAVPAVGIEPVTMLAEGDVSSMPRSRATLPLTTVNRLRTAADEFVPWSSLTDMPDDVVAELVARVLAESRTAR
jgi:hypothetical protein